MSPSEDNHDSNAVVRPLEAFGYQRDFGVRERLVQSVAQLATAQCRALYQWWRDWVDRTGTIPARSDFDIAAMRQLASHIFLVERVGPTRYRFRLHGEDALDLVGRSFRGAIYDATNGPPFARALTAYYTHLLTHGVAANCTGRLRFSGRDYQRFESVDVPLLDRDGVPNFILGVIVSTDIDHPP